MKILSDIYEYKANKDVNGDLKFGYIRKSLKSVSMIISITVMFFMLVARVFDKNASNIDIYVFLFSLLVAFLSILIRYFNSKYEKDITREIKSKEKTKTVTKIVDLENGYAEKIDVKDIKKGNIFILNRGDIVPCDATVIDGVALLDESCITGESAAVLVEEGGERDSVKEGTKLISDSLVVKAKSNSGESKNKRTINKRVIDDLDRRSRENKMTVLSIIVSILIILVYSHYNKIDLFEKIFYFLGIYIAILPDDIYNIFKFLKLFKGEILKYYNIDLKNINSIKKLADVKTILIDKTGTLTFGNREAIKIYPARNIYEDDVAEAAALSSAYDDTPEGKSILVYVKKLYSLRGKYIGQKDIKPISFALGSRISGCDLEGFKIRKGSEKAIKKFVEDNGGTYPIECKEISKKISIKGGTPLSIAVNDKVLGVIYLKDIVKEGLKKSFKKLENSGYDIVLATGDNPLTAATIAAECGINKFISEATPDNKLDFVEDCQSVGDKTAVVGDGENDIYALASADVSIVMGNSNEDVKSFGDIIDNDSDPAKIPMIIGISREVIKSEKIIKVIDYIKMIIKSVAVIILILPIIMNNNLYLKIDVSAMYLLLFNLFTSVLMMITVVFHKK